MLKLTRSKPQKVSIWSLGLLFLLLAVPFVFMASGHRAYAEDTTSYPWIRPVSWLDQVIASPTGGTGQGHIGVDILLGKTNQSYDPCHNVSDPYIAGCQNSGGYYKVLKYSSTSSDFPYGIFVDNSNSGSDHFWAKRTGVVFLEIYPYSVPVSAPLSGYRLDPGACACNVYGGLEVVINDWKGGSSPGSAFSANIGILKMTNLSEPDVGKMNGFIRNNGTPIGAGAVNVDWFGQDKTTTRSTGGFPVFSFASWPTNADGYYTSGPVLKGNYHIYVTSNGSPSRKIECYGVGVKGSADRLDMELTQQHFGLDGPGRQCYDR